MSCECRHTVETDSERIWNPITLNVEFRIIHTCINCGKKWVYSNVGVYR